MKADSSSLDGTDEALPAPTSPPSYTALPNGTHNDRTRRQSESSSRDSILDDLGVNHVLPVRDDGRLTLNVGNDTVQFYKHLISDFDSSDLAEDAKTIASISSAGSTHRPPRMNVVLQVVGSRGDVQPFLALALELQRYGHRVRLATHPLFRDLVESYSIEFFSIGGDPAELMAYMVQNPGLMPSFAAVHRGEVYKRRRAVREMLRGCWRSCFESTDVRNRSGALATASSSKRKIKTSAQPSPEPRPFVADAIIANPPSFGHVHCAEKLGIPLHIMFT